MGEHGNQYLALLDFLILSTLKDCRHFVSIKKNKNLRSMPTLELGQTWNFEVSDKI